MFNEETFLTRKNINVKFILNWKIFIQLWRNFYNNMADYQNHENCFNRASTGFPAKSREKVGTGSPKK